MERDPAMVIIVTGGPIGDPAFLRQRIASADRPVILCADGGARHLYPLGIVPQAIIGDLDSLDPEMAATFAERGVRIIRHPAAKDETDTELALRHAFTLNPASVRIFGALGNRIDHTWANISLLLAGARQGIDVKLVDPWCEVFAVMGQATLLGGAGETVSLFPLTTTVTGITLEGFAYPLKEAAMEIGRPYGVSNRLLGPSGSIAVASGCLLVIHFTEAERFPGED